MSGIGPPSVFVQEDGAKMAYEVLGHQHLRQNTPIVLVGGMSSLRGDWQRLAIALAEARTVLIFDHRGMGDSRFSPKKDEEISIESMARDLLALLKSLKWDKVSICGFSMGGAITQQLLFLPHLPSNPAHLPFCVTHVLLTGTLASPVRNTPFVLKFNQNLPTSSPLTQEQKRGITRLLLEGSFDQKWINENPQRFGWWLDRMIHGRPASTIMMQLGALRMLDFSGFHDKLSKETQVLVIHGELDEVVPFSYGLELMRKIPWARMVEVGPHPGQVESLAFGHQWFEYFDVQIWKDVFLNFLDNSDGVTLRSRM